MTEFAGWFATHASSLDPGTAVAHWGYLAVFVLVILGNAGVPVPEETVLLVAGFLVWSGQLRLDLVLAVGFVSAVVGDNIGYWLGRRFGRAARSSATPTGSSDTRSVSERCRGSWGGEAPRRSSSRASCLACASWPDLWRALSGSARGHSSSPTSSGAVVYVPIMVGGGWALGYGFGDYVEPLRHIVGNMEHVALWLVVAAAAALLALARHPGRARPPLLRDAWPSGLWPR